MKLDDLKWAVGELVSAALRPRHADCDCHPRLAYRDPAGRAEPDGAGPAAPLAAGAPEPADRPASVPAVTPTPR